MQTITSIPFSAPYRLADLPAAVGQRLLDGFVVLL